MANWRLINSSNDFKKGLVNLTDLPVSEENLPKSEEKGNRCTWPVKVDFL